MEIINNTSVSVEWICAGKLLLTVKNNWRQRDVKVYEHHNPDMVYTIGISFDQTKMFVCEENRGSWAKSLSRGLRHIVCD